MGVALQKKCQRRIQYFRTRVLNEWNHLILNFHATHGLQLQDDWRTG
jgi:hypothetical protein